MWGWPSALKQVWRQRSCRHARLGHNNDTQSQVLHVAHRHIQLVVCLFDELDSPLITSLMVLSAVPAFLFLPEPVRRPPLLDFFRSLRLALLCKKSNIEDCVLGCGTTFSSSTSSQRRLVTWLKVGPKGGRL